MRVNASPAQIAGKARAWMTRKARYGSSGNSRTYEKPAVSNRLRLARLVAVLIDDGVLTEGQLAGILEVDRLDVRVLRDDGVVCLEYRPVLGAWGGALMKRLRAV